MAKKKPKWADEQLSTEMHVVREAGENQNIEFKEKFPEQAHRLAKEFAAFGTSGGGRLFVGVNDNGDLVGIGAPDGESRDLFLPIR